jgi:hypothetical protein
LMGFGGGVEVGERGSDNVAFRVRGSGFCVPSSWFFVLCSGFCVSCFVFGVSSLLPAWFRWSGSSSLRSHAAGASSSVLDGAVPWRALVGLSIRLRSGQAARRSDSVGLAVGACGLGDVGQTATNGRGFMKPMRAVCHWLTRAGPMVWKWRSAAASRVAFIT